MRQFVLEFGQKIRVILVFGVGAFQLVDGISQRFADKAAAIGAEMAVGIGLGI